MVPTSTATPLQLSDTDPAHHSLLPRPDPPSTAKDQEILARIAECEAQLSALKAQLHESKHQWRESMNPSLDRTNLFSELEANEYKRYGRQLIMDEVGLEGQSRLKKTSVLIVGAGGLGCPAAAYLAGAGIGKLGLVDGDTVEESNLHRQILHSTSKVGWPKVDSAISYLKDLNPNAQYCAHVAPLSPSNAASVLSQYDIVLDCTDNPASRYLISDVCVHQGKPLVSASALKTEGQLMVLNFPARPPGYVPDPRNEPGAKGPPLRNPDAGGPCYRCVFPKPPPPEAVVSCGDGGILGPVVGTMGVLQALEAIKVVTSDLFWETKNKEANAIGNHSSTRSTIPSATFSPSLLVFSAYSVPQFRTVRLRGRRPECAVCSAQATITPELILSKPEDYIQVCGASVAVSTVIQSDNDYPVGRISASEACRRVFLRDSNTKNWVENPAKGDSESESMVKHSVDDGIVLGREVTALLDVREKVQWGIASLKQCASLPYNELARVRPAEWELFRQRLRLGTLLDRGGAEGGLSGDSHAGDEDADRGQGKLPKVLDLLMKEIVELVGQVDGNLQSEPASDLGAKFGGEDGDVRVGGIVIPASNALPSEHLSQPSSDKARIHLVTICRRGIDSQLSAKLLKRELGDVVIRVRSGNGQEDGKVAIEVSDVVGGFGSWRREVDCRFPEY